ncbi:MAG: cytochrome c [Gammaproteobacteria bacterium]
MVLLVVGTQAALADASSLIERGQYLTYAGGCLTCHTADKPGAIPLAGGRALDTPFGTFYSPNLTPDPDTGLRNWTDEDFEHALRDGRTPDGSFYYPVFPYPSYTGLSDADVRAIAAYLRSLPPVRQVIPPHDLPWYLSFRPVMYGWNLLNFRPQRFEPDNTKTPGWNRGAYVVRHLGHCGECHTPRNLLGAVDQKRELSGNPDGPEGDKVPDITQNRITGIGRWSTSEIELFLEIGILPDGDFVGSTMGAVIDDNTGHLTPTDRQAIATYLQSVDSPELP